MRNEHPRTGGVNPRNRSNHKAQFNQPLRANMTEWAVEQVKRLPKYCTRTQDKKRLMGLIALNRVMAKADEALEKAA